MSIHSHFSFTLTSDQEHAADLLTEFLNSKDQCFQLKGYAGTGKTSLIQGLVSYLNGQGRVFRLLAPTGRAAMIIGEKTQSEGSTMHRAIYDLEHFKDDDHTFRVHFNLRVNTDPTNTVYIIDESSMISDVFSDDEFFVFGSGYLLKDLFAYVDIAYRPDVKIIFVGDTAQLPPVSMSFSPALAREYLTSKYRIHSQEYELTEVVRQKHESGILNTATAIRNNLLEQNFSEFKIDTAPSDIIHCMADEFLGNYFKTGKDIIAGEKIVITYSNRQAHMYNEIVRSQLFEDSREIQVKDIVINTRNNYNYSTHVYNGQFAVVVDVQPDVETRRVRFKKKGGEIAQVDLHFRDVVLEIEDFKKQKSLFRCKILVNILDSHEPRILQDEQQALYVDFKIRNPNLKSGTEDFRNALKKDPYFNALQIKYGYAITCHKAQGGEWPEAFVDFQTAMAVASKGFNRWAYTAITRAKNHLWAIGVTERTPFTEYVIHPTATITSVPVDQYYIPADFFDQETEHSFSHPILKSIYLQIRAKIDDDEVKIDIAHFLYQERYTFGKNGNAAIFNFSYNKKGFANQRAQVSNTNASFATEIESKLARPLIFPVDHISETPTQKELYDLMKEVSDTAGTPITNIVHNQYFDRYFVFTGAHGAYVDWYFNDNKIYTSVRPGCTGGPNDVKLNSLIELLK